MMTCSIAGKEGSSTPTRPSQLDHFTYTPLHNACPSIFATRRWRLQVKPGVPTSSESNPELKLISNEKFKQISLLQSTACRILYDAVQQCMQAEGDITINQMPADPFLGANDDQTGPAMD